MLPITAIVCALLMSFLLGGCQCQRADREVLRETYVHKYGIEVPPEEWTSRGRNGEVITTRNDGVVVTTRYAKGLLQGDTTATYPHSSAIASRHSYDKGKLVAETLYYRSGGMVQLTTYQDGETEISSWYEGGEPHCIERWHDDALVSGEYYTLDHDVEGGVDDGRGLRIVRDDYGTLQRHEAFEGGYRILTTTFHSNGFPSVVTPELRGRSHGIVQRFHVDGSPESREEWQHGYRHGAALFYDHGHLIACVPYLRGKEEGVEERYDDAGGLRTRVSWTDGARHGPTYHYVQGDVKTEWFFHGEPVSAHSFALHSSKGQ